MEQGTSNPAPRASRGGLLASAVAVVVSLTSLGLAISGNHTQERMLAASVWPHVEYGTGNLNDAGEREIRLLLSNQGVGPARLKSLELRHDGRPVTRPDELLQRCCGASEGSLNWVSASTDRRVLPAGETLEFLRVSAEDNPPEVWLAFNRERHRLQVLGCYCSVLEDCWRLDSTQPEPSPVASCPAPAPELQWQG